MEMTYINSKYCLYCEQKVKCNGMVTTDSKVRLPFATKAEAKAALKTSLKLTKDFIKGDSEFLEYLFDDDYSIINYKITKDENNKNESVEFKAWYEDSLGQRYITNFKANIEINPLYRR